jgi:N-acetylmuramoyl-L-alanine amidase
MRSSDRTAAVVLTGVLLSAALSTGVRAQSAHAKDLYNEARAREVLLRKEMDAVRPDAASEPLLKKSRALVGAYADMSSLFPASGYSDNALWQGASLAADAFWQFGDASDRATALKMFNALTVRFPASSLVKQVPAPVTRLSAAAPTRTAAPARPAAPPPLVAAAPPPGATAPAPPPRAIPAPTPQRPATSGTVALTAIRHQSLPDALRVTLELDREVPFHDERLDGPPRVFLDLQNTRAVAALQDAILPFGDDLVRRVRVGRQLDSRTRVVLDLKLAARYSVYTLYNPYRVVIDFERGSPPAPIAPTSDARIAPTAGRAIAPTSEVQIAPTTVSRIAPTSRGAIAPTTEARVAPTTDAAPAAPSANTGGSFSLSRQLGLGAARIVIDAGHGGHDPGAKARGLAEADLVLDVALRLEKLLLTQPGVEVVLTRRTNTYVSLEERTEMANREGADLFLSIHANASANASARGVETYFLNFAPNPEAEAVAARENAGAARNMRHLPEIVKAIALNNKIDESRDFASSVQGSLHDRLRKVNRDVKSLGVKQAPFMVLIGATMPSILAEISFITNKQDANLLKTEKYRQEIAEALLAGVMKYQQSLKKLPAVASR